MLKPLRYYIPLIPASLVNTIDNSLFGYVLELAVKDFFGLPLTISKPNEIDLRMPINGRMCATDCKQNSSDWRNNLLGESYVAYCVYIDLDKTLAGQFGYIVHKRTFKTCADKVNLIRYGKKDSRGYSKDSLQTVYNYKLNKYHGAKAFKFTALLEEKPNVITFADYFKE